MKVRLVKNWRRGGRWFSAQLSGLGAGVATAWMVVPADMRAVVPESWMVAGAAVIFVLALVGRFIDQGGGDD